MTKSENALYCLINFVEDYITPERFDIKPKKDEKAFFEALNRQLERSKESLRSDNYYGQIFFPKKKYLKLLK